jgi:hypothetical protein
VVLGELIEDESGKITGQRVLDVEGPKMESSTMAGLYKEIEATDIGTYCSVMREEVMYADVQGVITAKDRQGMATYTAQAVGRFTSPGKVRFHGSVFYRTTPTGGGTYHSLITWLAFVNMKETSKGTARLKCGNGSSNEFYISL